MEELSTNLKKSCGIDLQNVDWMYAIGRNPPHPLRPLGSWSGSLRRWTSLQSSALWTLCLCSSAVQCRRPFHRPSYTLEFVDRAPRSRRSRTPAQRRPLVRAHPLAGTEIEASMRAANISTPSTFRGVFADAVRRMTMMEGNESQEMLPASSSPPPRPRRRLHNVTACIYLSPLHSPCQSRLRLHLLRMELNRALETGRARARGRLRQPMVESRRTQR
ncbi:hypothetical protein R3P38DRAFT_97785 [Favolaschia claudopus]|uniref:Uncharacterized protein n=1 Tax=Favolaschia claudopus TaxID=2862362 RepID=A0AAV9ZZ14_9AGAR